jgi:hypothetical protein
VRESHRLDIGEPGEPVHAGVRGAVRSLWWSWTPDDSGLATFTLAGSAGVSSGSRSGLAIYTGDALPALTEAASSNHSSLLTGSRAFPPGGPTVSLQVTAGTPHQIAVITDAPASSGVAVLNLNQPPTIFSAATAEAAAGAAFSYQIAASGSPAAYAVAGLPIGLVVDPWTGLISGTPATPGTYAVTLAAANPAGSSEATLTLLGAASLQLSASGSPTSLTASGLPPGLTLNASSGAITGTPTHRGDASRADRGAERDQQRERDAYLSHGSFALGLSATNAVGTGLATLRVFVGPIPPAINRITSSAAVPRSWGNPFPARSRRVSRRHPRPWAICRPEYFTTPARESSQALRRRRGHLRCPSRAT